MDLLDDDSSSSSFSMEEKEDKVVVQPEQQVTRKARKLLSLAAVLPQHILDELTQRQEDEDSSDEEKDDVKKDRKRPVSKIGISNFLSDLNAVRPKDCLVPRESSSARVSHTTPLGAAFLQTTTIVQKGNAVRNIHQEEDSSLFNEEEDAKHESRVEAPLPTTHIKRLSSAIRPVIESAPCVTLEQGSFSSKAPAPASAATYPSNPHRTDELPTTPAEDHNRKRTRREMENALRKGDFQQLDHAANVTHLEQSRPDSFVPDPETYAVPQHGIRVVPTAMYDPKAGTATSLAAGKGRGKNQIHHLMASAANLELQRARGMAGNSNTSHRANAKQKYGW